MSTATANPILVPPPTVIRERLAAAVAEARALRKLLKLAEAATAAESARARRSRAEEGGRRA
jgi:hypothetical protein